MGCHSRTQTCVSCSNTAIARSRGRRSQMSNKEILPSIGGSDADQMSSASAGAPPLRGLGPSSIIEGKGRVAVAGMHDAERASPAGAGASSLNNAGGSSLLVGERRAAVADGHDAERILPAGADAPSLSGVGPSALIVDEGRVAAVGGIDAEQSSSAGAGAFPLSDAGAPSLISVEGRAAVAGRASDLTVGGVPAAMEDEIDADGVSSAHASIVSRDRVAVASGQDAVLVPSMGAGAFVLSDAGAPSLIVNGVREAVAGGRDAERILSAGASDLPVSGAGAPSLIMGEDRAAEAGGPDTEPMFSAGAGGPGLSGVGVFSLIVNVNRSAVVGGHNSEQVLSAGLGACPSSDAGLLSSTAHRSIESLRTRYGAQHSGDSASHTNVGIGALSGSGALGDIVVDGNNGVKALKDFMRTYVDEGCVEDEESAALAACSAVVSIQSESSLAFKQKRFKSADRGICSWFADYLTEDPTYSPRKFREVFRIPVKLYCLLHKELLIEDRRLRQKEDCTGKKGASSHQKILSALRRLAEGCSFRTLDDNARMSKDSLKLYFNIFLDAMISRFGPKFLNREPSLPELRTITKQYEKEGFPGCFGSVDCMHLHWKNCPRAFKGQYRNPKNGKLATIVCEAVCDHNLYCWSWFVGRCGTNNDITVMDNSPFFQGILSGQRKIELPEGYYINGQQRHWPLYLLGDGIYPRWAIFVLPRSSPSSQKEQFMTSRQESTRKDVERLFGCLQGRFKILRREFFEWSDESIVKISKVCVIIHNMLVQLRLNGELDDEIDSNGRRISSESVVEEFAEEAVRDSVTIGPLQSSHTNSTPTPQSVLDSLLTQRDLLTSPQRHLRLAKELIDHLWKERKCFTG